MSRAAWPAPAKLNLFIHVTGRRPDGYHTLQTLFQMLDVGDELRIEVREEPAITRSGGPPGVAPEQDLTVRAAQLLQAEAGIRQGARIHLDKRLPAGGGLGGGSSDAATVLRALNRLWALDWPVDRLAALGGRLGADVPVFIRGHTAWAEGTGDLLTPVSDLPERWYAVLKPPVEVGTAEIYQAPELTRNTQPIKISGFLAGQARNDFLPIVKARYPVVGEALDWLDAYGEARLTGTGACVFAAFDSKAEAQRVIDARPAGYEGFAARGVSESPLLARLAQE